MLNENPVKTEFECASYSFLTDFDQVKTNMESMVSKASTTIAESNAEHIKVLFMDALKSLLQISTITEKFKSGNYYGFYISGSKTATNGATTFQGEMI